MKPIQRTDTLTQSKQLSGGKVLRYDEAGRGLRKLRCPKCSSLYMSPQAGAQGQVTYTCTCGYKCTSTTFGGAKKQGIAPVRSFSQSNPIVQNGLQKPAGRNTRVPAR